MHNVWQEENSSMTSRQHTPTPSFEEYMARRRDREQELLSRINAALAVLEARYPELLRARVQGRDPAWAILQWFTGLPEEQDVPCQKCTPFFEALLYLERQHLTLFQEQDLRLARLEQAEETLTDDDVYSYASLREAYEGLRAAHKALQLEYQDLETVYHASIKTSQGQKGE